ncbi:MAG: hypothetical protein HUU21_37430 [Polyangiaceae bacterium]|nr:hypothetical protein [Polyangiaceae bacterium]
MVAALFLPADSLGAGATHKGVPDLGNTLVSDSTPVGHCAVTPARFWSGSTFLGHAAVTPWRGSTLGRSRSLCRRRSSSCACFSRRSRFAFSRSFFGWTFLASGSFGSGFFGSGSFASFFFFGGGLVSVFLLAAFGSIFFFAAFGGHFRP